MRQHHRV